MALSAEMDGLKGELKLAKNVADKVENGNKKNKDKKKSKNKKSKIDKEKQKKDEANPPSPKGPQEKLVNKIPYHWCIHHMAWTAHKP